MRIESRGLYGDTKSGGGLFRGIKLANVSTDADGNNIPAAGAHLITNREVVGYYFDFFDETNELDLTNQWEAIDVGTMTLDPSTFIIQGGHGGVLRLDSDATDGDGNWIGLTLDASLGYSVVPAANRIICFEYRVTHADWDAHHWFVGLTEDVGGATGMDADGDMIAAKEYIGFHHNDDDDADGIPRLILAGANNTEVTTTPVDRSGNTVTISAGVDDTYRRFGVRIEGTDSVEWYIDNRLVGTATVASAFTAALYPGIGSVMNAAAGDEFDVDYCLVAATR